MALATLLGGSGFVGRGLAARLLADGWAVRVCARHPDAAGLPQGVAVRACDVRVPAQLRPAVEGSDAVVYLPGIVTQAGAQSFRALHVEAPHAAAEIARTAGARHFVLLSALGVAADSPAAADRTKIAGEAAVRAAFDGATVVRPSLVAGPGDHFVAQTAALLRSLPAFPLFGAGATRFQPLHRDDLVAGLAHLLAGRPAGTQTFELGGPDTLSLADIVANVRHRLGLRTPLVPLPFWLSAVLAQVGGWLPGAPVTPEQVRLLRTDKVVGGSEPGFFELGVTPRGFEATLADALPQG